MKALLIDAKDSFVYIISQYLQILNVDTTVIRENIISNNLDIVNEYDFIILAPGPGHPDDVCYQKIIHLYKEHKPILGICLGHQAIWQAFGGIISHAKLPIHGKIVDIENTQNSLFLGFPSITKGCRYHSLIAHEKNPVKDLDIIARAKNDNAIMGMRHKKYPIASLQFHPESIGSDNGILLIKNFISENVSRTRET